MKASKSLHFMVNAFLSKVNEEAIISKITLQSILPVLRRKNVVKQNVPVPVFLHFVYYCF